ncbi:hypothetical protein Tco_1151627, partial [Tanacetum coccineum]
LKVSCVVGSRQREQLTGRRQNDTEPYVFRVRAVKASQDGLGKRNQTAPYAHSLECEITDEDRADEEDVVD